MGLGAAIAGTASSARGKPAKPALPKVPLAFAVATRSVLDKNGKRIREPVVTRAWIDDQLENANSIFGEHDIRFREAKEMTTLDETHALLEDRGDRDALAAELRAGVINVFFVESLRDVDDPKLHRMGVMWRNLRDLKKKYVIVAASARETTMAHEIGHYLGNDHSYVKNNLMSYQRDGGKVTLNAEQAARSRRTAEAHFAKKDLVASDT
ncbi:MAG: hypothetical protein JNK04_22515 [Myxococcales bacterium]|nr:hypothetical protein [Myxococcales bacterium]